MKAIQKSKIELLEKVTGRKSNYYVEGYEDAFYQHYKLIADIKEALGTESMKKLYDLVNEETYELMNILNYLKEE